jgi:hypothetical protein
LLLVVSVVGIFVVSVVVVMDVVLSCCGVVSQMLADQVVVVGVAQHRPRLPEHALIH